MKAILYVIALLAIAAAAYFSFDNKGKFQEQQEIRLAKLSDNKTVSANADGTQKELSTEQENLTAAKSAKAEAEQTIANLESKETGLKREVGEIDSKLEEQKVKLDELANAMVEVKQIFSELGLDDDVDVNTIGDQINKLKDDQKELTAELAELETNVEGAQNAVENNRQEIERLANRKVLRDARIRANALESVVTAVNQDFGFVVIGAGRNTGFKPRTQARLIIKRDGRAIAEVKPTSIEANQTIADIDFDTVAPGVRIQPGDRVIVLKPATN